MKYRIISETHLFKELKGSWDYLFNLGIYSVFQSFDFNYYSWQTELVKNGLNFLTIIEIKTDHETIAILPLYIDQNKQLRFINDNHADFCDILTRIDLDLDAVLAYACNNLSYNSTHFINLKEDSYIYNYFKKKASANYYLKCFQAYSYLILSHNIFPENFSRYKSKNISNFRRIKKKNIDMLHYIISADDDVFPLKEITFLRNSMIDLGIRNANFLDNSRIELLEKLFNSQKLIISIVKKGSYPNAISLILKDCNEYIFWIDMYDDTKMINLYNYLSFIENKSKEMNSKINFGRGAYNYKIMNFLPDVKYLFAIFIFKNKFSKISFIFFNVLQDFIKSIYKLFLR